MSQNLHPFYGRLARILNSGKSRSVVLSGNVYDLFYDGRRWVPLLDFLIAKSALQPSEGSRGIVQVVYEVNRPVRVIETTNELEKSWNRFKRVTDRDKNSFSSLCEQTADNPTLALEFLRQLTVCTRQSRFFQDLIVIIESADLLLPNGNFASLQFADRKRISIALDWFSDPDFINGTDSVLLLTESKSLLHSLIISLPQVLAVNVPIPDLAAREKFAQDSFGHCRFADTTAGLSLQAYRQLLCDGEGLTQEDVIDKVEEFICSQLGDGVVEFKRPTHNLGQVIGYEHIKDFLRKDLMPRFRRSDDGALPGAAVAGPIGSGKTFIFEAMATELEMPVLVLKNLRSQWFGQTDVIFERLRRVLEALDKVCIFVDEADTQFGGVGPDTHETERRLTGKVQAMMSDPKLRGKVVWLLMTARIERLSPDIRRPGRVGDLIIPILDPEPEDLEKLCVWLEQAVADADRIQDNDRKEIDISRRRDRWRDHLNGLSMATITALRSKIKARNASFDEAESIMVDMLPAEIQDVRCYQTLQALLNCTSKSLIPQSYQKEHHHNLVLAREKWREQLRQMDLKGTQ